MGIEIFMFGFFIWSIGWFFTVGYAAGEIQYTRLAGTEKDKNDLNTPGMSTGIKFVLFFNWPNFLGKRYFKQWLLLRGIYDNTKQK